MKVKFYICSHCGNLVGVVKDAGVPIMCCGQKMDELVPNTVDASGEKHIPVVSVDGDTVKVNVGSVDHPMLDEHYIEWIFLLSEKGGQRRRLQPGDSPAATFKLADGDKAIAAYAYCNMHGLWMAEI